jgi:putative transposase
MRIGWTDSIPGQPTTKYFLTNHNSNLPIWYALLLEPVRLPPKSPNLNAHIERFMRSLKEECLEHLILFGEESLRNAVGEFLIHYHAERNHQALSNRLIDPGEEVGRATGEIACGERLGGILRYYYRKAA